MDMTAAEHVRFPQEDIAGQQTPYILPPKLPKGQRGSAGPHQAQKEQ